MTWEANGHRNILIEFLKRLQVYMKNDKGSTQASIKTLWAGGKYGRQIGRGVLHLLLEYTEGTPKSNNIHLEFGN